MKTKQEILVNVISAKLENAKVGVIVRGITEIDPVAAIDTLSQNNETKYYVSAVGYNISKAYETDMIAVSHMIEDAVRWRSEPALAGKIIAFVKSDSDKLHSLAEFDEVTTRDLSLQLIEERIAELEEEYELDIYDRNDIREEEYRKGGWKHDPFPEELEEEETEEECHYRSMEEQLNEVGMSMRDFF